MLLKLVLAGVVVTGIAITARPATADSVADFYAGKTITILVPSRLDNSMGHYARIVSKTLQRFIPGKPKITIRSIPGAGGIKGTAYVYNDGPKDGTMIAQVASGNVTLPALRKVEYDVTRFHWIGSATARPGVIWLWHNAPVKSFDDAKKIHVILGSTVRESGSFMWPALINHMLDTRFRIVTGYQDEAVLDQAAEQGEIHGRWTSYSDLETNQLQ